jgi:AbiV family abortive infection protein
MKVRRVGDLAQSSDPDFLAAIAEGCTLSLANAEQLFEEAQKVLAGGGRRGYLILRALAEEEASKALILLDAVRCPPAENARRSHQLRKFADHLSRMIYSEICSHRPVDYRGTEDAVERLREEYYLDGPSGFDWIYRNQLLQEREGILYVDYVETDDGRRWEMPNQALVDILTTGPPIPPHSLSTARHLSKVGAFTAQGIAIVAGVWRGCTPSSETKYATFRALNVRTLEELNAAGLCDDAGGADLQAVRDEWPFPLWPLDMTLKKVDFANMVEARDRLSARYPEGF